MLFIHLSLSEYQQFKRHSGDVAHLTKSLSLQISSRARQIFSLKAEIMVTVTSYSVISLIKPLNFNVKYSHYQTRKESEQ